MPDYAFLKIGQCREGVPHSLVLRYLSEVRRHHMHVHFPGKADCERSKTVDETNIWRMQLPPGSGRASHPAAHGRVRGRAQQICDPETIPPSSPAETHA